MARTAGSRRRDPENLAERERLRQWGFASDPVPARAGLLDDAGNIFLDQIAFGRQIVGGFGDQVQILPRDSCTALRSTAVDRWCARVRRGCGRMESNEPVSDTSSFVGPERSLKKFQPRYVASGTAISGMRMPGRSFPSVSTCGTSIGKAEPTFGGSWLMMPFDSKIRTVIHAICFVDVCRRGGAVEVREIRKFQFVGRNQRALADARVGAWRRLHAFGDPSIQRNQQFSCRPSIVERIVQLLADCRESEEMRRCHDFRPCTCRRGHSTSSARLLCRRSSS